MPAPRGPGAVRIFGWQMSDRYEPSGSHRSRGKSRFAFIRHSPPAMAAPGKIDASDVGWLLGGHWLVTGCWCMTGAGCWPKAA
jgi:hypothetical protein